jgi:hypothetical protein
LIPPTALAIQTHCMTQSVTVNMCLL